MRGEPPALSRHQAIRLVEGAYLAATTGLIWLALYYLPVGGALFRLALPLPLALLQLRRGGRSGVEGLLLSVLLMTALMGPVRGPLLLFPYGILAMWLGWCWGRGFSWWLSWSVGVVLGTLGFLTRVLVLSLLVGENLWVVITRAGAGMLERVITLLHLPISADLASVQLMALLLVVLQELIYVLSLHALAFWIFPRLRSSIPGPPRLLHGLVALDPL
tara:strand:+ start:210 stop:863 length:654 start_codon:yes stop_codon:yes gene_type:complete